MDALKVETIYVICDDFQEFKDNVISHYNKVFSDDRVKKIKWMHLDNKNMEVIKKEIQNVDHIIAYLNKKDMNLQVNQIRYCIKLNKPTTIFLKSSFVPHYISFINKYYINFVDREYGYREICDINDEGLEHGLEWNVFDTSLERYKKMKVYLAGEMGKEFDRENRTKNITEWRRNLIFEAKEKLNEDIEFICPDYMGCDHFGINPMMTIDEDTKMIEECDIVLAYLNRKELYGTIVEIMHAYNIGKKIFIITDLSNDDKNKHPHDMYIPTDTNHSCECGWDNFGFVNEYWFLLGFINQSGSLKTWNKENKTNFGYMNDNDTTIFDSFFRFCVEIYGFTFKKSYESIQKEANSFLKELIEDNPKYEKTIIQQKFKRDYKLVKKMKEKHNTCQICNFTFKKKNGENYNEVHHIISLGGGNNGKDAEINTFVVCANCHRQLHYADTDISKIKQGIVLINGEPKKILE